MHREKARDLLNMWRGRYALDPADVVAVLEHFPPTEPDPVRRLMPGAAGWSLGIDGDA